MDTSTFQSILFGIFVGAIYGLAALGLSLAFGVLKILNVSHGELVMVGGYATFFIFTSLGIDPFASMGIVFAILVVFGLVLHGLLFNHIVRLNEENRIKNSLLIGFGLTLVLHTAAVKLFTADDRSIFTDYSTGGWTFFDLKFPYIKVAGLVIAIAVVILMELFLTRTYWGKALRATSEDWTIAALSGIDTRRVYFVAFALAAGLAGITGALISVNFSVNPSIGLSWTLKALIVVVLAGLGSMRGTLLGGILLGIAEAISAIQFGGEYREIVGLVIFLIFLSFRPQGLFGGSHAAS
jgi:branched-chain amino acid transport system permease protein